MRVVIAGAGLAGLTAARELEHRGAEVVVIEARDRVGGRVWTMRDGFAHGQHAEAGADLVEENQDKVHELVRDLGLRTTRILRSGFAFFTLDSRGRTLRRKLEHGFDEIEARLGRLVKMHALAERRWDGPIAQKLARQSVAEWLDEIDATREVRGRIRGLRGLFLADPEDLSLLALVDFFGDLGESGGWSRMRRVVGGNDRVATSIARALRGPLHLSTVVSQVVTRGRGVRVTVDGPSGRAEIAGDFLVCTLPATTLRDVVFEPELPPLQRDAIMRLRYGAATRLVVQFERPFWRRRDRPSAWGTDQPTGAFWDASEEQKSPAALLSFLAGGTASAELRALIHNFGLDGLTRRLRFLGRPTRVLATRQHVWEDDPWSRGGYAYFDPSFDPSLRDWLARPHGRILFAGEHTSQRWQGYMNGAVESGLRAVEEILAMEV